MASTVFGVNESPNSPTAIVIVLAGGAEGFEIVDEEDTVMIDAAEDGLWEAFAEVDGFVDFFLVIVVKTDWGTNEAEVVGMVDIACTVGIDVPW